VRAEACRNSRSRTSSKSGLPDGRAGTGRAKQNRILNTDVLVPAKSTVKIPVSCVEQGRWHHNSRRSPAANRRVIALDLQSWPVSTRTSSVGQARRRPGCGLERSAESLKQSGATSDTNALSDAYAKREVDLGEFRRSLLLPTGAVGVAVFHGGKFQGWTSSTVIRRSSISGIAGGQLRHRPARSPGRSGSTGVR